MSKKIKKILITVGIILAVVVCIYSCTAGNYNKLVALDESVKSQWAQVENQYQRRYDLIPNLVETVKGYAKHENETLTGVMEAYSKLGGQIKIDENILEDEEKFAQYQKAQDSLGSTMSRLLAVTVNYPDLKANQNFLSLQDQLEGTENRISVERKRYNDAAQIYNTTIRTFPKVFIANLCGFKSKAYFTATEQAQTAPKVEF